MGRNTGRKRSLVSVVPALTGGAMTRIGAHPAVHCDDDASMPV